MLPNATLSSHLRWLGLNGHAWPRWLGWFLFLLALVHTALLWSLPDPSSSEAYWIAMLQPISAALAVVVMAGAATRHPTRVGRWAWVLNALGIASSTAGLVVQINDRFAGRPPISALSETLFLATYVLAVSGVALYLPRRLAHLSSVVRVVLDSCAVAVATLVLMLSLQPLLNLTWPWSVWAALYPAVDVGLVYGLAIINIRYGRGAGPLIWFGMLSLVCLLAADLVLAQVTANPTVQGWRLAAGPLFTLHRGLLGLGAYYAAISPPRPGPHRVELMPMHEWLLWTLIPRAMFVLSVAAIVITGEVPYVPMLALLILTVGREAFAALNQHSAWREAYRLRQREREARVAEQRARTAEQHAHRAERAATRQTEDLLARLIHDQASPIHGLWSVQQQLRRAGDRAVSGHLALHLDHLQQLFDQLQTYLRVRMRPTPLSLGPVDLLPVAVAAIDAVHLLAGQKRIHVRLSLDTEATVARGERIAIRRILDNLLTNALAVTPAGGEVVVTLQNSQCAQSALVLAVSDTGCGLDEDQQARVFQPFAQVQEGPGLGLGLAIVRDLAHALQGDVGIRSTPGAGSTFWVTLPQGRADGDLDVEREGENSGTAALGRDEMEDGQ